MTKLKNKNQKNEIELFKCNQKGCAFNNGVAMGCRACPDCKAEPNMVSDNCMRCWNCENKEGAVRWADNNKDNKEDEKETKKEEKEIPCIVG